MTLFNPFTKYALIVTPIASAIETCFVFSHKKVMSILVRTFLVASTVVVALTVPFFGYIMALVGSFLSCTASILLPCICYLKISRKSQRSVFEVVIIYVIIVIGALVAVLGTYTSLKDITNRLLWSLVVFSMSRTRGMYEVDPCRSCCTLESHAFFYFLNV